MIDVTTSLAQVQSYVDAHDRIIAWLLPFDDARLDGEWFNLDDESLAWLKSLQRLDSE